MLHYAWHIHLTNGTSPNVMIGWTGSNGSRQTYTLNHNHPYLSTSGGSISGALNINSKVNILNVSTLCNWIIDNNSGAYNDATLRPNTDNGCNIGSSSRRVSFGAFVTLANLSDRKLKENIYKYDEDLSYEQLKDIPFYNFAYKNDQLVDHNIGTMVEYMPVELLDTGRPDVNESDSSEVSSYSIGNTIFFTMAALKSAQSKVETLESEIDDLRLQNFDLEE